MKSKILKFFRKMIIAMSVVVGVILLVTILFVSISPQFGGKATEEQKANYRKSKHYQDGIFVNTKRVQMDMSLRDMGKSIIDYLKSQPNTTPKNDIPVEKSDSISIADYSGETRLIWFGHSTFLLQIHNKNILIDPMLGDVPAPHPMLGGKRFSKQLPIEIEKLPQIDAVILSHDHYDHLDYGSIKKLKDKVKAFYMPLGVGVHLQEWGIEKSLINELDWWQEIAFEELQLVCTPAQHFSGRGFSDRAKTLWSSWVIQSDKEKIYFSGDSGYADHFKVIGDTYGPFDFAMMECGQYNEKWPEIHMFPEETAQAGLDVRAKRIMPIHWGAFKLAMHTWTDPVERVTKKAKELGVEVITPKIGESIFLKEGTNANNDWWKE
ncbi:MBL fold metallo-hydrolase [Spongiivirga sp. MCCC 1A20706]|uniref:MBL fold metallo-hydrolase n=1 Tax=Spongiivirga sp. MCCC 1A20706 TaxID=3160963 RepID=UPI003977650D